MDSSSTHKSSKDLMYSEYTGTTVAGHVLERLKQNTGMSLKEKIDFYKKSNGKSETFEKIRKFVSLIDENPEINVSNEADKGEIEVTMEINENAPESNPDAWFIFNRAKSGDTSDDESKSSDDESVQNSHISSTQRSVLDYTDSSDSSSDSDASLIEGLADPVYLPMCSETLECHCGNDSLSARDSDKRFIKLFSSTSQHRLHCRSRKTNVLVEEQTIDYQKEKNCCKEFSSIHTSGIDSTNVTTDKFVQNSSYSNEKKDMYDADNQSLNISDNEHSVSFSAKKKILNVVENGSCNLLHNGCDQNISYSQKKNCDNDSLNPSLDKCVQNISFSTGKKNLNVVNDRSFDFSIVAFDVSAPVEKEKLNDSEPVAVRLSNSDDFQLFSSATERKKKICVIEDFSHVDSIQPKKICLQKT